MSKKDVLMVINEMCSLSIKEIEKLPSISLMKPYINETLSVISGICTGAILMDENKEN